MVKCNIEEFTEKMMKKYPDSIYRDLDERSDSNTVAFMRDVEGDPIEFANNLRDRILEISGLGELEFEVETSESSLPLESWVTLSDPCSENLVDKAVDAGFVWL